MKTHETALKITQNGPSKMEITHVDKSKNNHKDSPEKKKKTYPEKILVVYSRYFVNFSGEF